MSKPWKATGGSLIGPGHRKTKTPNQDAFGYHIDDTIAIIAAADGAGSLKLSDVGARLAVEVFIEEILVASRAHELELLVEIAIERAREAILNHPDAEHMGCTFAGVVMTPEEWALGTVGDAFAVVHSSEDLYELHMNKTVSEYANVTRFLTSDDYHILLASGNTPLLAAAVATDGLEYSSLQKNKALPGFWRPVFKWAAEDALDVDSLLEHMDKQEKISDDTTLLVATRESG